MVKRNGLAQTGMIFTTASAVHARPFADFCLMAMLMFAKNYVWMERDKKAKRWERYCGEELTGKTLAIVGVGRVGQEVARHGKRMDMRVTGMRRSDAPMPDVDKLFARAERHTMPREADFVVLAAPHDAETEGIIGEAELAVMKPTAVLINIGRGALIDEDALIRALQHKRLAGAALDVFRDEPPPPDSPLWNMPNVIVSPHSASTVTQENARITDIFVDNLRRYLRGEPLRNVLDKTKLYRIAPIPSDVHPRTCWRVVACGPILHVLAEHAVIVHLRLSESGFGTAAERQRLADLEKRVERSIKKARVGEFDGNEFGEGEW